MELTRDNYHLVRNKRVYLWGALQGRIKKLFEEVGDTSNIIAVVDNGFKNVESTIHICGRELNVIPPSELEQETQRYSVVVTCNHYSEIAEQIMRTKKLAAMVNEVYLFVQPSKFYSEYYRKKYEDRPLEDIFLFYSGPSRDHYMPEWEFADNSRALFEYLLEKGYNKKYTLVWLVKEPEEYEKYSGYNNVRFISFNWADTSNKGLRERYFHDIFLAKYIFTSEAFGFARYARPGQVRVELWHGCGFKQRHSQIRHEEYYEFMTVISQFYKEIHARQYGLRMDQLLVTGYPKDDWLFQPYPRPIWDMFSVSPAQKVVFWLPTFRSTVPGVMHLNQYEINPETGLPIMETKAEMDRLNELLVQLNTSLVIKLHPAQEPSVVARVNYSNILLLTQKDLSERNLVINRLLASADALISDYSSAAVDYLILDRPIGFTLDDKERFDDTRGLVFDPIEDWLPGKKIYSFTDFCEFLAEIANGVDSELETRRRLLYKMHDFHDGNSCQRVLDALGITKD